MSPAKVSPLAPAGFPSLPTIAGVTFAAGPCGIRYKGRTDLMLAAFGPATTVAGVFTKSTTASAPVDWCRKVLTNGKARALVVNSGNANVFTGPPGDEAVVRTAKAAATLLGCKPEEVYVSSTGVIGELLPVEKIETGLPPLKGQLKADGWEPAARAIMTTDTFPKGASRKAKIGNAEVQLAGFIKGSGMIAPNMATMLGYVFTDAKLPAKVLQGLLTPSVEATFNCITVDSDTSTSDTILLFATGEGQAHPEISRLDDPALSDFRAKLLDICMELAHLVIRDGEGATKFITVKVGGAKDDASAKTIGLAIANSPLIKTALAAGDANWGRIVMAIGKTGEPIDRSKVDIYVGGVPICRNGGLVPGYDETPVAAHMAGQDILIEVSVGIGSGKATVWTCDLTHEYININANYRS
jgi:glutamate N-acetyltransferase/amino-acid N-acetyltransferase